MRLRRLWASRPHADPHLADRPGRADSEYIPILSPSDGGARPVSRLDTGAFMRYRLDEKQLSPKLFVSLSKSPEHEFASLVAKIHEDLEKLDVEMVAVEEVLVRAMGDPAKIAIGEA